MTRTTAQILSLPLVAVLAVLAAPAARADYAVLRSGQRIEITGFERLTNRLTNGVTGAVTGGVADGVTGAAAGGVTDGVTGGVTEIVRLHVAGGSVDLPAEELIAVEPQETFPPNAIATLNVPYAEHIRAASAAYGVDARLIASVIAVESNFNPRAVSRKSAQGLMQLIPSTAARLGVRDAFDARQNIDGGTRYLKELLGRYTQDVTLALAAYNAGPQMVDLYRGVPPFQETCDYVRRVTEKLRNQNVSPKPAGVPRPIR